MRAGGRYIVLALCVFAFLLLLPALVDKPAGQTQPPPAPLAVPMLKAAGPAEVQPGDRLIQASREGAGHTPALCCRDKEPAQVGADANGNPLTGGTYIRCVYRAFRLEEKAG